MLPASWVEPYRPANPGIAFELGPTKDTGRAYESRAFTFQSYSEAAGDFRRVEGRYYRSLKVPDGERAPLLLISPILAGASNDYLECRIFARWACAEGISAFYIYQDYHILTPERDAVNLERVLRENIQDTIRALDLLTTLPGIDATRLGSLGISMGAIKNVALIAVEPRLAANVLCLGGADVAQVLRTSREFLVLEYLRSRRIRDGFTVEETASEFHRFLDVDPRRYAEGVANDRVLLFLGTIDDKVPYPTGRFLWEKLGEPEAYEIHLGHYSGILAAPFAAGKMFRYFKERVEAPGRS